MEKYKVGHEVGDRDRDRDRAACGDRAQMWFELAKRRQFIIINSAKRTNK